MRTIILSLLPFLGLAGCATTAKRPAPPVVERVDLERYLGQWYELARLPASFQKGCVATTATYSMREDGKIRVVNACRKETLEGKTRNAEGKAWVVDPATNARLKVTFFWPFSGDYWVVGLDPEYQWALVGTPDYKYLWLLSRTPQVPEAQYEQLVEQARALGYPVEKLIVTLQPKGG